MPFYPENEPVPSGLKTEEFTLRPLRATDVELDYDALMSSQEMLRLAEEGGWPAEDFTLAENLEDLQRHERDHIERSAFTFTLMNPSETECLGCLYIQPLDPALADIRKNARDMTVKHYEAVVTFWVRSSRLADHLDQRLLSALIPWFRQEWTFSRVLFATNSKVEHQVRNFDKFGLEQLHAIAKPHREGRELIYG